MHQNYFQYCIITKHNGKWSILFHVKTIQNPYILRYHLIVLVKLSKHILISYILVHKPCKILVFLLQQNKANCT